MWNSIKSFFGVSSSSSEEEHDRHQLSDAEFAAKEIKDAQSLLDKLRQELAEVEKAIKDSRRLVSKAEVQQSSFKRTLSNLEMECHDEYLHPITEDELVRTSNNTSNDDDDQHQKENNNNNESNTNDINNSTRSNLKKAIHALETLYLPQIELQKDNLDLTAFRLSLRLTKLKAEEDAARRRVLSLQAEAHERYEKYKAVDHLSSSSSVSGGEQGHEEGSHHHQNANDLIPRPSSTTIAETEDEEGRQFSELNENDINYHNHSNNSVVVEEEPNQRRRSIIPPPPPPELVVKR